MNERRIQLYVASGGSLRRFHRGGRLLVPGGIEVKGECLCWDLLGRDGKRPRYVRPSPDMLDSFIRLADASERKILAFARKWGVLGLCEHDYPCTHDTSCSPKGISPEELRGAKLKLQKRFRCSEPLETWRGSARSFEGLLRIAAQIQQGKRGDPLDWLFSGVVSIELVDGNEVVPREVVSMIRENLHVDFSQLLSLSPNKEAEKQHLARTLNFYLGSGGVAPNVEVREDSWEITLSSGLFILGALSVQLMLAICRTEGLGLCTACGNAFVVTGRRPSRNRRSYCERCGKRAADADAARDYRRRRKEALGLFAAGEPDEVVAEKTNTRATTIAQWRKQVRESS